MFDVVTKFEKEIASFFGAPYAVAVDCCTHGIELCLRYENIQKIIVPKRTYLSIPMLAAKLKIKLNWKEEDWKDYYYLGRGGIILTDNKESAKILKMMSYDGRENSANIPWVDQDISVLGFHYYMTPETAQKGLDELPLAIKKPPRQWKITDWPDLTNKTYFKERKDND